MAEFVSWLMMRESLDWLIRLQMRYLGKTSIYEGKLFIHGRIYNLIYVGYDEFKGWIWYNIKGVYIPYTEEGSKRYGKWYNL